MPALPYMGGVIEAFMDPYDAERNPDGLILLAVAENKLSWDVLKPRTSAALASCPDWVSNYGPMSGQPPFKEALASFLGNYIFKGCTVDADNLVCASGLTSILSNFFYVLCEPGETVLIPAPYYAAFDSDLRAFAEVGIEPVAVVALDVKSPEYGSLTVRALDAAYERVVSRTGLAPRALLLTNPHNPFGRIAGVEELAAIVGWCGRRGVHLVADEIYALSCFGPNACDSDDAAAQIPEMRAANDEMERQVAAFDLAQCEGGLQMMREQLATTKPLSYEHGRIKRFMKLTEARLKALTSFTSVATLCGLGADGDGADKTKVPKNFGQAAGLMPKEHVHLLWGMSKDFGMSGLRLGVLWTNNPKLRAAMETAVTFSCVSGPAQAMTMEVLSDENFVNAFVSYNNRMLRSSLNLVETTLNKHEIPYFPPESGMFIWVDLGEFAATWEDEAELYDGLWKQAKIILTPGSSQHADRPGWFRICYAFVPPATLELALGRLSKYLKGRRGQGA